MFQVVIFNYFLINPEKYSRTCTRPSLLSMFCASNFDLSEEKQSLGSNAVLQFGYFDCYTVFTIINKFN